MSESRTDGSQPSDFTRALNSMMDNLENVAVTFQKTLLVMLEKIEKLESLERFSRGDTVLNERGPNSEKVKQLTNDATTSAKTLHQESSEAHNETEMTANTETKSRLYQNEIICVIAIALAILGIIIVKLYFMLF